MDYIGIVHRLCEETGYPSHVFVPCDVRKGFISECQKMQRYEYASYHPNLISASYQDTKVESWPEGNLCG